MNIEKRNYKLTLTTELLGTVPKDKEIYETYIETKKPPDLNNESESETVQEIEEKGWTGFHQDDNGLFIFNYMIKGFLKSAIQTLMENKSLNKIPAYKSWIDRMIFINPRKLYFNINEPDGVLERSLRVMTMQGPRVSLARSDTINSGRSIEFDIELFKNTKGLTWEVLDKSFEYGQYIGLGQWRSGDYGRFVVEQK